MLIDYQAMSMSKALTSCYSDENFVKVPLLDFSLQFPTFSVQLETVV